MVAQHLDELLQQPDEEFGPSIAKIRVTVLVGELTRCLVSVPHRQLCLGDEDETTVAARLLTSAGVRFVATLLGSIEVVKLDAPHLLIYSGEDSVDLAE